MHLEHYEKVPDFAEDVLPTLLEDETLNNLPIGLINAAPKRDTSDWLMRSVKDSQGKIVLTALRTPPYGIILSAAKGADFKKAAHLLAENLKAEGLILPGASGSRELVREFAERFSGNYSTKFELLIMRQDCPPEAPEAPGFLREITSADLHFLPFWGHEFGVECGVAHQSVSQLHDSFAARIGQGEIFIWQDEIPRAITAIGRKLANGSVINYVYSLPFLRGKGYGRAVVSAVCREIFERGGNFVTLFANSKNPVSCGLYHSLGFKDAGEYEELTFE